MSPRTVFLSRLMGLSIAIMALTMLANRDATVAAFVALVADPPALWLSGLLGLVAGAALVIGHNVWSGGAATVAVTVVGWVVLIKGIAVLALPAGAMAAMTGWLRSAAFFYGDAAFLLVLGLALAYAGFTASRRRGP